jgi:uncharacterized protein YndB with AHSA1/START domain
MTTTATNKPNELYIRRRYDAPLAMVWEAWTNAQSAAHWWGPRGFTITTKSKDFRTGGSWIYTMHGPDGVDYPNHTKFLEVQKHVRMVYDHGGNEDQPPMFRVTACFAQIAEQTELDMTMAFANAEAAVQARKFIKMAGGDATWDRLAEYLAQQKDGKEVFVINRSFAAPIDRMYKVWTDPLHLAKWLAPNGSMEFLRAKIHPGGSTFSVMRHGPESPAMYGRANYLELSSPNRIVYTQQFCDEQENVVRHPMSPTWPETKLTTVTFTAEGDSQTRVTLVWEPFGQVSNEEMTTFCNARAGMTMGWTGSLDGLEAYLAVTA